MNRFRMCAMALFAFVLSARALEGLRDLRTEGFCVTLDQSGALRVGYLDLPLVTGCSFEISSPQWSNVVPGRTPKWRVTDSRTDTARTFKFGAAVAGQGACATTVTVAPQVLKVVNEFSAEAVPGVGIFYTECFFSRDALADKTFKSDNGASGTLTVGKGTTYTKGLKKLELATELGTLVVAVSESYTIAGAEAGQAWEFRSVCDRPWGAEDRRTFSLMNVRMLTPPQLASGRTEYEFTFVPAADIAEKLAERRARVEAARAAEMAELAAAETARQARLRERGGAILYPTPQRYERLPGQLVVAKGTPVVVPDGAGEVERRGAERLCEELETYQGVPLRIVEESKWAGTGSAVQIGTKAARKTLAGRLETSRKEGYSLAVTPEGIMLAGTDPAGTWYGVQALLQLPQWQGSQLTMPSLRIDDWPDFEVRAMTLMLGSPSQMDFLRHTIRRVLPRQRVNMIFVGGASLGKVRWPSHPEVGNKDSFTPEQIRELADLARANFIEPVPHVQGFGHTGPLVGTRPDLLAPREAGRAPCFDITRKDVRAFIFDIYADAIEAFQAKRYFHVGFDEAQGLDRICGDRSHAEVVAEHITEVDGWLRKRGLRMIMWADMLLDNQTFGKSSAANSKAVHYGNVDTAPALAMIPKDVILANWYYGIAEEHPQIAYLQQAGFEIFPTTWYRPANNFCFLRSAQEAGLKWAAGSSWMYCSANNPTMMGSLLGEYAWTAGRPELAQLDYDELALFHHLLQPPRVSDRPCRQRTIDLSGAANRELADPIPDDGEGWLDLGPSRDFSALKPGTLESTPYDRTFRFAVAGEESARCVFVQGKEWSLRNVPATATVPVGGRADALVFLHTDTADDCGTGLAGAYRIVYEDGSTVVFALHNALQIAGWLKPTHYSSWRAARQQTYCRDCTLGWRGLTLDGRTIELSLTEWRNPNPGLPVRELQVTPAADGALALVGLTALEAR